MLIIRRVSCCLFSVSSCRLSFNCRLFSVFCRSVSHCRLQASVINCHLMSFAFLQCDTNPFTAIVHTELIFSSFHYFLRLLSPFSFLFFVLFRWQASRIHIVCWASNRTAVRPCRRCRCRRLRAPSPRIWAVALITVPQTRRRIASTAFAWASSGARRREVDGSSATLWAARCRPSSSRPPALSRTRLAPNGMRNSNCKCTQINTN